MPTLVEVQVIAQQHWCAKARVREEPGDIAAQAFGQPVDQQDVIPDIWVGLNRRHPVAQMGTALRQIVQKPTQESLHAPASPCLGAHQPTEDVRCLRVRRRGELVEQVEITGGQLYWALAYPSHHLPE